MGKPHFQPVPTLDYHLKYNKFPASPGLMNIHADPFQAQNGYIYASTPIVDSQNISASVAMVSPPMDGQIFRGPAPANPTVDRLSVVGCLLSMYYQNAIIDTQTDRILSFEKPNWKTFSQWKDWEPVPDDDFYVNITPSTANH